MDLVALTLIASSMLALFGAILAGFIFAPWVMAFGALGLLALLPRVTTVESAAPNSSAPANDRVGNNPTSRENRPDAPLSSSTIGRDAAQTTEHLSTTLQYRGSLYRSAVSSKAAALEEPSVSDR